MKSYKFYNNLFGWVAFAVAAITYLLTLEPTASFWDCGEFISTAKKLVVGHPPGAPLFMIIGNFFGLFSFGNPKNFAVMVNALSAFASAATIMFLFWSITHLAKKMMIADEETDEPWRTWAVMASGMIGALAFTFSDTFWFSAVEGEVYALSSLFTAVVFWAILKWENVANEQYSNRWLILIAYLMGLSIGVHLLNLLAIPAIVMVYYFKKFEVNRNNTLKALGIGALLLLTILYGIIPGSIKLAGQFELFFVNGLGLPFNTGAFVYLTLLAGALVYGIWYTYNNGKVILNTILLGVTVILIGYSSFAIIVIRSSAQPTMDQNSPDDVFSLIGYLNREQYGDRPLIAGPNYNSPVIKTNEGKDGGGDPVYVQKGGRYEIVDYKVEYEYDPATTTLLPRMHSRDPRHIREYESWANVEGRPVTVEGQDGKNTTIMVPTAWENLKFLWNYQINFMYFRYFMWNFAGRQNDIASSGELHKGNWQTGISFVDSAFLGDQSKLPDVYKNNKANNKYFLLPLLLGVLGMVFQYNSGKEGKRSFWIVAMLFFLTGLAIVMYLNQTPLQPRERDYAYVGSFYAFAIWIGLGVLGVIELIQRFLKGNMAVGVAFGTTLLLVPVVMAAQNWDDHDRSNRYIARDLGVDYLMSCEKDAVLFTNGDNDTFPLWYAQEVEGVRTDVRVCNLSYLQTDWYIDQMKRKAYLSDALPISFTKDQYITGTNDVVWLLDRTQKKPIDLKDALDWVKSTEPETKQIPGYPEKVSHFPSKSFVLPIDSAAVLKSGIVSKEAAKDLRKYILLQFDKQYIMKSELMILDMLINNQWKRPIYYAVTVGDENYCGLQDCFQLEGLAYRVVPVQSRSNEMENGTVNTKIMYDNVMNKFKWGGFDNPKVYLDENHLRMAMNIRSNLGRLASSLIDEGEKDKASKVLALAESKLPSKLVPYNYFSLSLADGFYRIGDTSNGDRILKEFGEGTTQELDYFISQSSRFQKSVQGDTERSMAIFVEILKVAKRHNREVLAKKFESQYGEYAGKMGFTR